MLVAAELVSRRGETQAKAISMTWIKGRANRFETKQMVTDIVRIDQPTGAAQADSDIGLDADQRLFGNELPCRAEQETLPHEVGLVIRQRVEVFRQAIRVGDIKLRDVGRIEPQPRFQTKEERHAASSEVRQIVVRNPRFLPEVICLLISSVKNEQ